MNLYLLHDWLINSPSSAGNNDLQEGRQTNKTKNCSEIRHTVPTAFHQNALAQIGFNNSLEWCLFNQRYRRWKYRYLCDLKFAASIVAKFSIHNAPTEKTTAKPSALSTSYIKWKIATKGNNNYELMKEIWYAHYSTTVHPGTDYELSGRFAKLIL